MTWVERGWVKAYILENEEIIVVVTFVYGDGKYISKNRFQSCQ